MRKRLRQLAGLCPQAPLVEKKEKAVEALADPLRPSITLLGKLGFIAVRIEEYLDTRHDFDYLALRRLLADEEVRAWLEGMAAMAHIPRRKR
jgi:hypothetical protein